MMIEAVLGFMIFTMVCFIVFMMFVGVVMCVASYKDGHRTVVFDHAQKQRDYEMQQVSENIKRDRLDSLTRSDHYGGNGGS